MAAMIPNIFMSTGSMTDSRRIWYASTTSIKATAGYIPRLSLSSFQHTMVSKRPLRASDSIRWNSGRFLVQLLPTS